MDGMVDVGVVADSVNIAMLGHHGFRAYFGARCGNSSEAAKGRERGMCREKSGAGGRDLEQMMQGRQN
jgi:hypothetical protein